MPDDWRPSASVAALRRRAELLALVRRFFDARGVIEVETPVLVRDAVTDIHLESFAVHYEGPRAPVDGRLWLQTSPEYAMKRLLAAGSGPVFQICRAFRAGERGRLHNPEFTLLEWYRPGFDHRAMMDEVAALAGALLPGRAVGSIRYRDAFLRHAGIDPFVVADGDLAAAAGRHTDAATVAALSRDGRLDLIMGSVVAPALGRDSLCFLTDFPASQAALARLEPDDPDVARRFELFVDGIEIANGFHELSDAQEQRRRFRSDRAVRQARGEAVPEIDERLLAALAAGLPDCAGVALGLDRLFMLALGAASIDEVMAFPAERA